MTKDTLAMIQRVIQLGIAADDAWALRRISMTLSRWHELECGDGNNTKIPDKERGALRRLESIMKRYPAHVHYVQTDPRGPALYVMREGDIPDGSKLSEVYSRGVAIYK